MSEYDPVSNFLLASAKDENTFPGLFRRESPINFSVPLVALCIGVQNNKTAEYFKITNE